VDISAQESEVLDPALLRTIDLLVTVRGHADESCPVLPASCNKEHWPFDDPARATGTEEEIMAEFRRVRDRIRAQVEAFISGREAC